MRWIPSDEDALGDTGFPPNPRSDFHPIARILGTSDQHGTTPLFRMSIGALLHEVVDAVSLNLGCVSVNRGFVQSNMA